MGMSHHLLLSLQAQQKNLNSPVFVPHPRLRRSAGQGHKNDKRLLAKANRQIHRGATDLIKVQFLTEETMTEAPIYVHVYFQVTIKHKILENNLDSCF